MTPDLVIGVIEKIGEMLEPAALAAWQVYLNQVHVQAVQFVWGAIILGALSIVALIATFADQDPMPFFFFLLFMCVAILCAMGAYGRFANPAFYAIKMILMVAQ